VWPDSVSAPYDYIEPPPKCCKKVASSVGSDEDNESHYSMEADDDKADDDYGNEDDEDDSWDDDNDDGDDDDHGTNDSNQSKTNVADDNNRCPSRRLVLDMVCDWTREQPLTVEFVLLLTNGTPPLHFACLQPCYSWFPYRKQTLEKLAALSSPEDWRRFHQGMLPLHCACRSRAEKDILLWISEKYPEALRTCTTDTMDSPLHCYLSSSTITTVSNTTTSTMTMQDDAVACPSSLLLPLYSFSTVQYLVKEYPAAIRSVNRSGWLPIHLAVMHDAPLDILFYLARNNPESLLRGIF